MESKKLRDLKKGELFKLRETESAPVWIKGDYVRENSINRYSCTKYSDANCEKHICGDTTVYVGFTF